MVRSPSLPARGLGQRVGINIVIGGPERVGINIASSGLKGRVEWVGSWPLGCCILLAYGPFALAVDMQVGKLAALKPYMTMAPKPLNERFEVSGC